MLQRLLVFGVITLALSTATAQANDTTANFAAGGITFRRTNEIRMVSEDLFLSTDEVRASYRFRNITNQDMTETVAFPMPDIRTSFSDAAYPDGPSDNPMRFSVTVDGERSLPGSSNPPPRNAPAAEIGEGRRSWGSRRSILRKSDCHVGVARTADPSNDGTNCAKWIRVA